MNRPLRRPFRLALSFAAIRLALGCSPEEISYATQDPLEDGASDEASHPHSKGRPCQMNSDCGPTSFCAQRACGDIGSCEPKPPQCPPDLDPVCGCDFLTYLNECLARMSGVATLAHGQCEATTFEAQTCGGAPGSLCPQGSVCGRLFPDGPQTCSGDAPGLCWFPPPACSNGSSGSERWSPCGPPRARPDDPPPAFSRCVDTCTALASGVPYARDVSCP